MNRPFFSETLNVYDQNNYKTVPAQFGSNNLLINHGQHRKMFDTTTTTITGQSPQFPSLIHQPQLRNGNGFHSNGYGCHNNELSSGNHPQFLTQTHPFSQGITYTFHPAGQNGYHHAYCNNPPNTTGFSQQSLNLQQQIALNQLQKHALESLLLHEQFKENPFKLQFHRDSQTNTENVTKTADICMCKNSLLNQLQPYNPINVDQKDKPEQFFPESAQRRQLSITPLMPYSSHEDKETQFSPPQETIEVQTDAVRICKCKQQSDLAKANQTDPKKVTFDKPYSPHNRRRTRKRSNSRRKVDEDSSDSSQDLSSSSKSSEDSK